MEIRKRRIRHEAAGSLRVAELGRATCGEAARGVILLGVIVIVFKKQIVFKNKMSILCSKKQTNSRP